VSSFHEREVKSGAVSMKMITNDMTIIVVSFWSLLPSLVLPSPSFTSGFFEVAVPVVS
jgi:hypothetical protein